jgi:hypothetical protein
MRVKAIQFNLFQDDFDMNELKEFLKNTDYKVSNDIPYGFCIANGTDIWSLVSGDYIILDENSKEILVSSERDFEAMSKREESYVGKL